MNEFEITLPKTDIMLSAASEIHQLCKPLESFGINCVSYTRVYSDGSFIDLSNRAEMMDYYYYRSKAYQDYIPDIVPELMGEGIHLVSNFACDEATRELRESFNIDNVTVLITKLDDYYELWNMGTDRNRPDIFNFYFNHQDLLQKFSYYFKDRGANLIKKFEQDKIKRKISSSYKAKVSKTIDTLQNKADKLSIQLDAKIERYYVNNSFYLTKRECQCLKLLSQGFSMKEIGTALGISSKTAEFHLDSIKKKSGLIKRKDIINLARKL